MWKVSARRIKAKRMQSRKRRFRDFYDDHALMYDQWSPKIHTARGRYTYLKRFWTILRLSGVSEGKTVSSILDVGCGTGNYVIWLSRFCDNIWGIDFSEEMVKEAKTRIQEGGLEDRVSVLIGDAESLPFASNYFDLTISNEVLPHLEDPLKCLEEMARITKKGGQIVIACHNFYSAFSRALTLEFGYVGSQLSQRQMRRSGIKMTSLPDSWFTLSDLADMFKRAGLEGIVAKRIIFVPSRVPAPMMGIVQRIDSVLGDVPMINRLSGVLVIRGVKG